MAAGPTAATAATGRRAVVARRIEDQAVVATSSTRLPGDEPLDVVDDPADRSVGQPRQLGVAAGPGDGGTGAVDVCHGGPGRGRRERHRPGAGKQVQHGRLRRGVATASRTPGSAPAPGTARPVRSASAAARNGGRRPRLATRSGRRRSPTASRRRGRSGGRRPPAAGSRGGSSASAAGRSTISSPNRSSRRPSAVQELVCRSHACA